MQYFRKPLALIFSLSFFLISFLTYLPQPSHAALDASKIADFVKNFPADNPWALSKEFCDKRSGNLMNLETWFSGKCDKDTSSLRGEGVGFVDIIILQGFEWLLQPQTKSLPEQMVEILEQITNIQSSLTYDNYPKKLQELSLIQSKQNDLVSKAELLTKNLINSKPATTTEYIAYISNNLKKNHIVDSAYAATPGMGFTGLSPVLPLWRAFRNIAYMLFAIAFVIYGIMIMFRVRIDSKTAATIQLAIPKLITTLLLITFSYAIVGLLVDISTVIAALGIDVLRVGKIIADPISGGVNWASGQSKMGAVGSFLINTLLGIIVSPFIIFNLLLGGALGVAGALVGIVAGMLTGFGILIAIIIIISIIWSYFKLILKLFQCYLSVIISLIFSPIILLGNVFPGSKAFSGWIMGIIGNLAAFPVASFFLVLSYALMMQPVVNLFGGSSAAFGVMPLSTGIGTSLWTPPMTIPTGTNYGDLMLAAIGLGLLLMSSKYVDMVLEALKVPPFKYGAAIGEALKYGYNQTGDYDPATGKGSGFRMSPLGGIASGAEGRYTGTTGREFFNDTTPWFGKPNSGGKAT